MKAILTLVLSTVVTFTLTAIPALQAQPSAQLEVSDKASRSRGGAEARDPNIKSETTANTPGKKTPPPPQKGGTARAGVCAIKFDNWTDLKVKVYVDGEYRGLMGPWDDFTAMAISGETRVYARAEYTDGTYSYWGPRVFQCTRGEIYTWKLGD